MGVIAPEQTPANQARCREIKGDCGQGEIEMDHVGGSSHKDVAGEMMPAERLTIPKAALRLSSSTHPLGILPALY